MTGFWRRFVKDYAKIAKPITNLLQKDKPFIWGEEQEQAFITMKDRLVNPLILTPFDDKKDITLHADGSLKGIGACLCISINGRDQPVAFTSRTLSAPEENYTITEIELLALVFSLKKFRHYLFGQDFIFFTDHIAISHLQKIIRTVE